MTKPWRNFNESMPEQLTPEQVAYLTQWFLAHQPAYLASASVMRDVAADGGAVLAMVIDLESGASVDFAPFIVLVPPQAFRHLDLGERFTERHVIGIELQRFAALVAEAESRRDHRAQVSVECETDSRRSQRPALSLVPLEPESTT